MTDLEIDKCAEKLYIYGKLKQTLHTADAIIALGNMDVRIAEKAAQLWHEGNAPIVVASGGVGRLTPKTWAKSEAAIFADVLNKAGIPHEDVIVEDKSTNLPENIRYSVEALKSKNIPFHHLILVALPFAERRVLALCKKQFHDMEIQMTSPDVTYPNFINEVISREEALNLIVGEIDRLDKFPSKGFSAGEDIPKGILEAVALLIKEGFNKYQVM